MCMVIQQGLQEPLWFVVFLLKVRRSKGEAGRRHSGCRGKSTKTPGVRKEDIGMGQKHGKTSSWCKGFVSGITVGTVLQRTSWTLTESGWSGTFCEIHSAGILTKHFFFTKQRGSAFHLYILSIWTDYLKQDLKSNSEVSWWWMVGADALWVALGHISTYCFQNLLLFYMITQGMGKLIHYRGVLGFGQGNVFGKNWGLQIFAKEKKIKKKIPQWYCKQSSWADEEECSVMKNKNLQISFIWCIHQSSEKKSMDFYP